MKQAIKSDGPFLLHAQVMKEDNVFPMVAPATSLSDTIYYPDFKPEEISTENTKNENSKFLENKM